MGINNAVVTGYTTGRVSGDRLVGGLVGINNGVLTGYVTGEVFGIGSNLEIGGLVGDNNVGTANGYWDIGGSMQSDGSGANTATFTGVGISSITHVVYDSGTDTYTDTKGTPADTTDDIMVFDNQAFTNSFTLPGASETWPTLNAANSFPQQP